MNADEKSKCHKIIHTASLAAAGVASGLAQLPGSDAIPITAIQIGMIISLGAVFGREITETTAKSILGGAVAAFTGRGVSQLLVGWIPGFGNLINAGTAASITEGLGWTVANNFDNESRKEELEDGEE
jgi:uncharacterized protein (DUF697 family)